MTDEEIRAIRKRRTAMMWPWVPELADECLARGRRIAELEAEVSGLKETCAILADPKAMEAIRQSEADIAAGRVIPHDEAFAELDASQP